MTQNLLPCPFCGGECSTGTVKYADKTVEEQGWEQDTFYFANCMQCGAKNTGLVGHDTREAAITAWNRRVPVESALQAQPDLRRAVKTAIFETPTAHLVSRDILISNIERALESTLQARPAQPVIAILHALDRDVELTGTVCVETIEAARALLSQPQNNNSI